MTDKEKELVEKNEHIIGVFCKNFDLDINEWYGRLAVVLCESAIKYETFPNPRHLRFEVYLYHKFKSSLKCALDNKRLSFNDTMYYLDNEVVLPSGEVVSYGETLYAENPFVLGEIVDNFRRLGLTKKQLKAVYLKYTGETQTTIAKSIGCSQRDISFLLSGLMDTTRKFLELEKGE